MPQVPTGAQSLLFLFVQRIMPASVRLEQIRREFGVAVKQRRGGLAGAPLDLRRRVLAHEIDAGQQRATLWPGEPSNLSPAILRLASARMMFAGPVDVESLVSDSLTVGRGIAAAVHAPFEFRLYGGPRYAVRSVRHPGGTAQLHGVLVREGAALIRGSAVIALRRDGTREALQGISPSTAAAVLRELPELVTTLEHELTQATHEFADAIRQLRQL